jgi:coproporphyrinogen III oxidase-like Fe-S oxidoreductase
VDENLACEMYDELISHATHNGFRQYEIAIANFGRDGRIQVLLTWDEIPCRKHNVNYWRGGSFYGLGPSATGYVRGVRTKNWANTQLYCEQLEKGRRAIESSEELPPLKRAGEIAAFGLRMNSGWPFAEFKRATDFDLRNEWDSEMEPVDRNAAGLRATMKNSNLRRKDCASPIQRRNYFSVEIYTAGSRTVKTVPTFSALETSIVPPCAPTTALEIARPRPLPPVERDLSAR